MTTTLTIMIKTHHQQRYLTLRFYTLDMDIDCCPHLMIISIEGNTFPTYASTIISLYFTRNAAAKVFNSTMGTLRQIQTLKFFTSRLNKSPICLVEFYSSDYVDSKDEQMKEDYYCLVVALLYHGATDNLSTQ